jgi:hypothetical protein
LETIKRNDWGTGKNRIVFEKWRRKDWNVLIHINK